MAMRNPWAKNANERGVPYALRHVKLAAQWCLGVKLFQSQRTCSATDFPVLEVALIERRAGNLTGQLEKVIAHGLGGLLNGECRHAGARAGEGPRVIRLQVGIDIVHHDLGGSRVQYGGGDLPLGVPDAVAEFGRARGQVKRPAGEQC